MNIKTINLTGGEVAVKVGGGNSEIKNNGAATIYASAASGIVAGADGVVSIPAGASVTVTDTRGTVYILGAGSVEVVGKDFVAPVFKSAAAAGGIGSNLLRNPNFAINQRGKISYLVTGYTADCWFSQSMFEVTPLETGIRIRCTEEITSNVFCLYQHVPITQSLKASDFTLTANVASTNDYAYMVIYAYNAANSVVKSSEKISLKAGINSVTIRNLPETAAYIRVQFTINAGAQIDDSLEIAWAKLETGNCATPFIPPEYSDELARCQRYYQTRTTGDVAAADMRPSMATIKDIKQREDGLYEYIAE